MTTLDPHVRGDTFKRTVPITMDGSAYPASSFTGGIKFTLRTSVPDSNVVDDEDDGVIDQASVAGGEITLDEDEVTITIPAIRTNIWPRSRLYWDLQGVIAGATPAVHTLDSGEIAIRGDVTRST